MLPVDGGAWDATDATGNPMVDRFATMPGNQRGADRGGGGMTVTSTPDVALATRLVGAVWGHLLGDAMGVPYEFRSADQVGVVRWGEKGSHRQPPGTWSDDGALMLALLD